MGRAEDALGPIFRLERSVDGRPWEVFFPDDDLLDEATESFEVPLGNVPPGEHLIAVRAFDSSGNLGSAQQKVTIPRRRD